MLANQGSRQGLVYLGGQQRGVPLRIGDLAALMIYAQYLVLWQRRRVAFELVQPLHREMCLDRLFPQVISEVLSCLPEGQEFHDPGPLWIVVPELVARFGAEILPSLHFEQALYTGPELPSSPYCVFATCFRPPYNPSRGMSPAMVNALLHDLTVNFGKKVVVVTDRPSLIQVPEAVIFPPSDVYSLLYLINSATAFIGGDTGFSHFAGLSRVPVVVSLYGNNSYGVTSEYGEQWMGRLWNSLPSTDERMTVHHVHLMSGNELISMQRYAIVKAVAQALSVGVRRPIP